MRRAVVSNCRGQTGAAVRQSGQSRRELKPVASRTAFIAAFVAAVTAMYSPTLAAAESCNAASLRCIVDSSMAFSGGGWLPDAYSLVIDSPNGPTMLSANNAILSSGNVFARSDQYGTLPFDFYGSTQLNGGAAGALSVAASIFDTQGIDLINHGSFVQQSAGQLNLVQAVRFVNTATGSYWLMNDNGIGGGPGAQASFLNQGAVFKAAGSGSSLISTPFDQINGSLEVWHGQVVLAGGGTQNGARFFADALLNNDHPQGVGLVFGGTAANPHLFTGTVLTETGAMVLAPGALIQTTGSWIQNANFDNQGQINVGGGGWLSYYSPNALLTNHGQLKLAADGLANFYKLDNHGSIQVIDNRLQVDQLLTLSGGTVLVQGLTTRPQLSQIAAINPQGGVLELDHADATVGSGLLTADPVSGMPGVIAAGTQLRLRNDATLMLSELHLTTGPGGPSPTLVANAGNLELHDTSRLLGSDGQDALPWLRNNQAGARLSLQDGAVLTLQGDLGNAGTLHVGASSTLNVRNLTQTDGLLTVDGTLDNGGAGGVTTLLGGVLNGNGVINGDLFVGGGAGVASFKPGHSPGQMTISGGLTLGAGGVLELEIERGSDGLLHWDQVNADSMSFGAGSLVRVLIGDSAAGAAPQTLDMLSCPNGCSFDGDLVVQGAATGQFVFGDSGLSFLLAPVPEPAVSSLMLAGLLGLALAGRRRGRSLG